MLDCFKLTRIGFDKSINLNDVFELLSRKIWRVNIEKERFFN